MKQNRREGLSSEGASFLPIVPLNLHSAMRSGSEHSSSTWRNKFRLNLNWRHFREQVSGTQRPRKAASLKLIRRS
ncbi:MAG: hypothetical protein ACTS68_01695 [Candidatus Hodgkinia cicadicola]